MLLLSIHPKYVEAILSGEKTVELRRQCPRQNVSEALIYASSPRMELVAKFQISKVSELPLCMLWQSVRYSAEVSEDEFYEYFDGLETGIGIHIANVIPMKRAIPLSELREKWINFHPPQSFRYLDSSQLNFLEFSTQKRRAA